MSHHCPADWRFTGDPTPLARDNIYGYWLLTSRWFSEKVQDCSGIIEWSFGVAPVALTSISGHKVIAK